MAFLAQQRLPVGSRRQANAAPARRGGVVRSAPVTVSEPAATKDVSPFLNGIQFLNPVWSKVENEEQFFGVLKVGMNGADEFASYCHACTNSGEQMPVQSQAAPG
jgi:hypothetical protein